MNIAIMITFISLVLLTLSFLTYTLLKVIRKSDWSDVLATITKEKSKAKK